MKSKVLTIRFLGSLFFLSLCIALSSCSSPENKLARHQEKAREYIEKKKFDEAIIELRNVVQLDPNNDTAYYDLGELYVKLEQEGNAAKNFAKAAALNPDNLKAMFRMGQIYLASGRPRMARKTADLLIEKSPDNVEAMHLLARVQYQERNVHAAIRTLENALLIAPDNAKTHLFMGHMFKFAGDPGKAEEAYLKAISLNESLRAPYIDLIDLYKARGETGKIESLLIRMIGTPGNSSEKLCDLAGFYEEQEKPELAEKTYLEAVAVASGDDPVPLHRLGIFYAKRSSYDKAVEALHKAVAIDENDVTALVTLAEIDFGFNRLDKAESTVDKILKLDSEHEKANYMKGRLRLLKKDYSGAWERFNNVISKNPNNFNSFYFRALCLIKGGASHRPGQSLFRVAAGYDDPDQWNNKLATEDLTKALGLNPKMLKAKLLLAELHIQEKETGLARKYLKDALAQAPESIKGLELLGRLKILDGDMAGAEAAYRKTIEVDPGFAPGHVKLGLLYSSLKKEKEAIESFKKALVLDPLQVDALRCLVDIHIRAGRTDKALEICRTHKQGGGLNRESVAVVEYLEGKIFMVNGDLKKARQFFRQSIERNPELKSPRESLAAIFEKEGDLSRAVEHHKAVLRIDPNSLTSCMRLSRIHRFQGDNKKVEKYLRAALEIRKDYAPAANDLAYLLAESGINLPEARKLAQAAKAKRPDDPNVLDTLGWVYYQQGSFSLAISELAESIALAPDNPQTHYHIGLAYYENREFEKSRQHMSRALKLDPDFSGADEARSILGE